MNHFRAYHFRAYQFAPNQFAGKAGSDTHDLGTDNFWYRHWLKLHKKRKPTIEDVIAEVIAEPMEAVKAVPSVKQHFQHIDYNIAIAANYEMQLFVAEKLYQKMIEIEREEEEIEMLLLM